MKGSSPVRVASSFEGRLRRDCYLKGMQVQNERIKSGLGCIIIRRKTSARLLPSWRRKEHSERPHTSIILIPSQPLHVPHPCSSASKRTALVSVINSFDEDLLLMSWWPCSLSLSIVVCHCYQIPFTSKYSIEMSCTCILLVLSHT